MTRVTICSVDNSSVNDIFLSIQLNFTVINIYNVFAKIPGSIEDDRLVLAGGHRDAWVRTYNNTFLLNSSINSMAL